MDHEQHEMSENRETANSAMDRAILHLAGDIASGRAEEPGSFPEHLAQGAKCSGKEKECTMLPQAILPFTGCKRPV
ncbi:MAG: hypothetical protein ACLFVO_17715 [Chloroflexaceae bacterium]